MSTAKNFSDANNASNSAKPEITQNLFDKYQSLFSGQTFNDIKVLHRAIKMANKSKLHQAGAVVFYRAGAVASILPGVDIRPIVRGDATQVLPFGVQVHNTVRGVQSSSLPLVQSVHDAHDGQFAQGGYTGEKNIHENAFNGISTFWYKFSQTKEDLEKKKKKTLVTRAQDKIFEKILGAGRFLGYKNTQSEGKENIPEENAIFATTHFTDFDVPLAAHELHKMWRNLSVVSQKTNLEFQNSFGIPQAAGKDRFLPIENYKRKEKIQGSEWGYTLHYADFVKFRDAVHSGKDLVIAGHRPTHDGKLPPKMGIGAILIGFITEKSIIPVSLETSENKEQKILYSPKIQLPELTTEEKENLNAWLDGKIPLDKKIIKKAGEAAEQLRNIYIKIEKK